MRIAYLSVSDIPSRTANSIQVMKMCQAFAQNGHDVLLLAPDVPGTEPDVDDIFAYYDVDRCFDVRKLPWPNVKGQRLLFALRSAWVARMHRPTLAYGRCLHSCFFGALLGIDIAFEEHSLRPNLGRISRWMYEQLVRSPRLRRIVVISDALRRAFSREYDVPEQKITVAHDAADEVECSSEPLSLRRGEQLQVGYVGHLYSGKGMEVIAELVGRCPWADFHVVGGTERDVERWRSWLGDRSNLFLHGFVPHRETARYRRACDVLLAPYQRSVSTSGGGDIASWMSPLKLFEYMAAAKPILCSDLPVLREVLSHRENAWLCPPGDVRAWEEALTYLRDHPEEREAMGARAYNDFKANHTWQARARMVVAELE